MKTAISFRAVADFSPRLVALVIDKLGQNQKGLLPAQIVWALVSCDDDPDQPLDETAAADLLLTGRLNGRHGVCGRIGRYFACYCDEGCAPIGRPAPFVG